MKSAEEQLSTYKSVHLSRKNINTHFIGIPMIVWAIMVGLSLISVPLSIDGNNPVTFAFVIFTLILVYYFFLNISLAVGQLVFFIPALYTADMVAQNSGAGWIALVVFISGWVFQFIGHHYEKAKPAFVDDLNQLLIGPLFIMAEIFFMAGALKPLNKSVTEKAIEKRRIFESNKC